MYASVKSCNIKQAGMQAGVQRVGGPGSWVQGPGSRVYVQGPVQGLGQNKIKLGELHERDRTPK